MPKVAAMDKIYHYEVTNFHEKVAAMDKKYHQIAKINIMLFQLNMEHNVELWML